MMAVRSVAAMDVQLALILDVQFCGTSAIDHLDFDAALEGGVFGLEGFKLGPEGLMLDLEGLQILGLLDLEGLKARLQRGGSARVRGLWSMAEVPQNCTSRMSAS